MASLVLEIGTEVLLAENIPATDDQPEIHVGIAHGEIIAIDENDRTIAVRVRITRSNSMPSMIGVEVTMAFAAHRERGAPE